MDERLAALALAGALAPLQAHDPEPPREIRGGCQSATDGCRVCKLDTAGGVVGCSFPGIACLPAEWRCNDRQGLGDATPDATREGHAPAPAE